MYSIWLASFTEDRLPRNSSYRLSLERVEAMRHYDLWRIGGMSTNAAVYGNDIGLITSVPRGEVYSGEYLAENALAVVNGYVLPITNNSGNQYIYDGVDFLGSSGNHAISMIDFAELGGVEIFSPTKDDVRKVESPYYVTANGKVEVVVDLPKDYVSKTPFVVIAGAIYLLDGSVKQLSTKQVKITLDIQRVINHIQHLKKVRKSFDFIPSAKINDTGVRADLLDVELLLADKNSFVGFIGSTDLKIFRETIPESSSPMMYMHYRVPSGIYHFNDGRLAQPTVQGYNQERCSLSVYYEQTGDEYHETATWTVNSAKGPVKDNSVTRKYPILYVLDVYRF